MKEQEFKEQMMKGTPGKGHQGGYKLICTRCMVQYQLEKMDKCTHCGKHDGLMT